MIPVVPRDVNKFGQQVSNVRVTPVRNYFSVHILLPLSLPRPAGIRQALPTIEVADNSTYTVPGYQQSYSEHSGIVSTSLIGLLPVPLFLRQHGIPYSLSENWNWSIGDDINGHTTDTALLAADYPFDRYLDKYLRG